jgi:hypothetical protein
MDLACLDGVGPIVHHHIVIVADVRQAATHKQNSSFCNKDGLTCSSFQAFATNMVLRSQAFKLLQPRVHALTQSSYQAFATNMVLPDKISSFCNKHGLTQSSFCNTNDKKAFSTQEKNHGFCNKQNSQI